MEVITCLDCKKRTDTVIDYRSGDTICTECGLILDSHYIVDSFDRNISYMTPSIRTKHKVGTNVLIKNPNPKDKASSISFRVSSPSCCSHYALLEVEVHHTRLIEELGFKKKKPIWLSLLIIIYSLLFVYLILIYLIKCSWDLIVLQFTWDRCLITKASSLKLRIFNDLPCLWCRDEVSFGGDSYIILTI